MQKNSNLNLTKRQQEILDFIRETIVKTASPPTRAEIAAVFGFKSPNAAEDHLQALARKNAIELISSTSRGIRLKNAELNNQEIDNFSKKVITLPLIGRVAAGSPILAQEHIDKAFHVEASLFNQTPDYLLRVRGMSMCDIGIIEGDLLAVKKMHEAKNGQIIVARIDGDVTVKRFQRSGSSIALLPENQDFSPIIVTEANDFSIEGLAVGLIREQLFC